jgi:hypothetical protein
MNPLLNDEEVAKILSETNAALLPSLQSLIRKRMSEIEIAMNGLLDSMGQQQTSPRHSRPLQDIQYLPNPISNSLHLMPNTLTHPTSIVLQKEHLLQGILRNEQIIQEQQRKSAMQQIIHRRLSNLQSLGVSQSSQKQGKRSLELSANPRKKARPSSIIDLTDDDKRPKDPSVTGIAKLPCMKKLKPIEQHSQKLANVHGKSRELRATTATSSSFGPRSKISH